MAGSVCATQPRIRSASSSAFTSPGAEHAEDLSHGAFDGANPAWANIVEQIGHLIGRPGLGAFLAAGSDRAALGAWLADHASDPLADAAMAQLRRQN